MGKLTAAVRALAPLIGSGLFVAVASYVIQDTVPASDIRDAVLLLMWPAGLLAAVLIAWRWLGAPTDRAKKAALQRVIDSGAAFRGRLASVTVDRPDNEAFTQWQGRTMGWIEEAEETVRRVAPHRLGGFRRHVYVAGTPHEPDVPRWVADLLVEVDDRLERLELIRETV